MITKSVFHPIKKYLIEERDYGSFGLVLKRIRRFSYDDDFRLIEINHYDNKNRWLFGKEFIYNEAGQPFAELTNDPSLEVPLREFHIFDKSNRIVTTYGELATGHQYCHEFGYNDKDEKKFLSSGFLTRDIDLQDIYEKDLKQRQNSSGTFQFSTRQSISSEYWSCELCNGDNSTGCLWHDPTECPKW